MPQDTIAYKTYTTQYFKTHFAQILRELETRKIKGAVITSHGRHVGLFLPYHMILRDEGGK